LPCDFHFLRSSPFGFQPFLALPSLLLHQWTRLIKLDHRKTVPVHILKIGDHASKGRNLWRTVKFHAPLFPFAVFSLNIFRQKY
jgi:hypothetical protein